jgi:hypothetical protein
VHGAPRPDSTFWYETLRWAGRARFYAATYVPAGLAGTYVAVDLGWALGARAAG